MSLVVTVSLGGIIFIAGIVFGATGFGPTAIFQIGFWTLVTFDILPKSSTLTEAVVYLALSFNIVAMGQALYHWQYLKFQPIFSSLYIFFSFIASIIGSQLLLYTSGNILMTRILGAVFLLTFIIQIFQQYIFHKLCHKRSKDNDNKFDTLQMTENANDEILSNKSNAQQPLLKEQENKENIKGIPDDVGKFQMDKWSKYVLLIGVCLLSGFLRGLYNAGGPPMIIYALITNIDRRIIRVINTFAVGYSAGIPLLVNLIILNGKFDANEWQTYLSNFISFLLGLLFGNFIQKYLDQVIFRNILLCILFCGAINLILIDLGNISIYSSFVLTIIFVILIIYSGIKVIININKARDSTNNVEGDAMTDTSS